MSESGSPFRGDRPETESWAARVFAANAASEAASGGFEASAWSGDVSTGVDADTQAVVAFVHNFSSIVRPVYALWVALAFFAAARTAGGRAIYTRRRR